MYPTNLIYKKLYTNMKIVYNFLYYCQLIALIKDYLISSKKILVAVITFLNRSAWS